MGRLDQAIRVANPRHSRRGRSDSGKWRAEQVNLCRFVHLALVQGPRIAGANSGRPDRVPWPVAMSTPKAWPWKVRAISSCAVTVVVASIGSAASAAKDGRRRLVVGGKGGECPEGRENGDATDTESTMGIGFD